MSQYGIIGGPFCANSVVLVVLSQIIDSELSIS